jgi:hypothetical protein
MSVIKGETNARLRTAWNHYCDLARPQGGVNDLPIELSRGPRQLATPGEKRGPGLAGCFAKDGADATSECGRNTRPTHLELANIE